MSESTIFPPKFSPRLKRLSPEEYASYIPPATNELYTGKGTVDQYVGVGLGTRDNLMRAGLKPNDSVLDIGCGIGRVALGVLDYLSDEGHYDGFDIVPRGVKWCTDKITPKHPNFRFQYVKLFNDAYGGTEGAYSYNDGLGENLKRSDQTDAAKFEFPYESNSFNCAYAISLFTHLASEEVERYIEEINRVLKPGGFAYITCFILKHVGEDAHFNFVHPSGKGFAHRKDSPLDAIAFEEDYLVGLVENAGLKIQNIEYRGWRGKAYPAGFQDALIFRKPV